MATREDLTPLHVAAQNGHVGTVELLLNEGADFNLRFDGQTPLYLAARSGHTPVVRLLIGKGADACEKTGNGPNPLHIVAAKGVHRFGGASHRHWRRCQRKRRREHASSVHDGFRGSLRDGRVPNCAGCRCQRTKRRRFQCSAGGKPTRAPGAGGSAAQKRSSRLGARTESHTTPLSGSPRR